MNVKRLQRELAQQFGRPQITGILAQHARMRGETPARCGLASERRPKVIYDSERAALECAAELMTAGQPREYAYECARNPSDRHFHLTHSWPAQAQQRIRSAGGSS